jgi:hypothetical protein
MGKASRRKRERIHGSIESVEAIRLTPSSSMAQAKLPLSAALIDIIEPYSAEATTLNAYSVLIKLASLGWNLTLIPQTERKKALADLVEQIAPSDSDAVHEVVESLRQRKEFLFPYDTRWVVSTNVTMGPNGYHVEVASGGSR